MRHLVIALVTVGTVAVGQQDSLVFYQDATWSPDGDEILLSRMVLRGDSIVSSIVSVDPEGNGFRFVTQGPRDQWTAWSPDGMKIAYGSKIDGNTDIYVKNLADGSLQRLTDDPGEDSHPDWSPDGSAITFAAKPGDTWQIHVVNADGSGRKQLTNTPGHKWNPRWSPSGKEIAFYTAATDTDSILVMNRDGTNLRGVGSGIWPSWASDTTLLFIDAGNAYRMKLDGTDRRFMVARTVFAKPSPDGEMIAFVQETWRAPGGWPASTALLLINSDGTGRRKITEQ